MGRGVDVRYMFLIATVLLAAFLLDSFNPTGYYEAASDKSQSMTGLLNYWKLDETTGLTFKDTVGSNNGVCFGSFCPVKGVEGRVKNAANFDGFDDHISLNNMDLSGSALTISAWVNIEDFDFTDGSVIAKANAPNEQRHTWSLGTVERPGSPGIYVEQFRLKTGTYSAWSGTTTLIANPGIAPLQTNRWYHLTAVYDGNNMILYRNGQEVGRTPKTGPIAANNEIEAWIGNNPNNPSSQVFDGSIDEVRIYNRALARWEIRQLVGSEQGSPRPLKEGESALVHVEKPVDARFTLSRTSGVAPLSVFFDATATLGKNAPRPFYDLQYNWNFGDALSGAWGTNGESKNSAQGPLATHVFETPGTYVVKLTVTDKKGNKQTKQRTITVQDPEVVFSTSTYCFANTNAPTTAFDECPTSDPTKHIREDSFTQIILGHAGANKRLLLRRGDTFSTTITNLLPAGDTGILGAYGDCSSQDSLGICDNNPIIDATQTNGGKTILLGANDWRIMDLHLIGPDTTTWSPAIFTGTIVHQILMNRLTIETFNTAISISRNTQAAQEHDQVTIINSNIKDTGSFGTYIGAERAAILGSTFDDSKEYLIGMHYANKAVINSNTLTGAGTAYQCILLYAPPWALQNKITKKVIISDNEIKCDSTWQVVLGPKTTNDDHRVKEILAERNEFMGNPSVARSLFVRSATDVTVRNNLFITSQGMPTSSAIVVAKEASTPVTPTNTEVYHNTLVANTGNRILLVLRDHIGNVPLMNNILYTPNSPSSLLLTGTSAGFATAQGNFVATSPQANLFVNLGVNDLHIPGNSPARSIGVPVAIMEDYDHNKRPLGAGYDAGAYEVV